MLSRKLNTMGVAWYASKIYSTEIDDREQAFSLTPSIAIREATFNGISQQEKIDFLFEVLSARDSKIITNEIGLSPHDIKIMAIRVLAIIY
jgi:hypothetical protein